MPPHVPPVDQDSGRPPADFVKRAGQRFPGIWPELESNAHAAVVAAYSRECGTHRRSGFDAQVGYRSWHAWVVL